MGRLRGDAVTAADRLAAALAGRYRFDVDEHGTARLLGAGGMATVYLARDLRHDRAVAIKVLRPELAAVIGAERFLSEIRTTANLQHPHILPLFDSGEADSFLFYAMPFVEGESLRDRLNREKQLPIGDAVRIATEVASALDYAHRHGVIHRDIKPENILLHDGRALVADFGIALAASKAGTRMTETGMSLGTPQYMSPEQAMGERELDARSDVYALGCVTYEMLSGEPPFSGPTAQAIVAKVMTAEPVNLATLRKSVPWHVADAVHTALQKLPADRFASAAEFAKALTDGSGAARRPAHTAGRGASRRLWPTSGTGVLLAVAIGAALGGVWLGRRGSLPDPGLQLARQLTFDGNVTTAAITADGKSLAYVTDDCLGQVNVCNLTLRVRDVDGTQSLAIAKSWRQFTRVKWSPDGSRLAILGSPDSAPAAVYVTDKLGGSVRALRVSATAVAFTRDSRSITLAVGIGPQALERFDVATLARTDSMPLPRPWIIRDLDYAPDRNRIIASALSPNISGGILALLGADGRVVDSLTEGGTRDPIRWSPDGSAVYTFEYAPGVADNLFRIPIRGDRIDTLHRSIALGQVSGSALGLFDASATGRFALVTFQESYGLALHTGPTDDPWRTISHRTGYIEPWGIAPSGNAVAAVATDNLGDNVASFPFDSTMAPQAITATRGVRQFPRWSPDGRRLAYLAYTPRSSALVMIDASGGAERRIAPDFPAFAWLANDALVILSSDMVRTVDTLGHARSQLAVPPEFRSTGFLAAKDPTSSRVAYASDPAGGIVIVDLDKKSFTLAIPRQPSLEPVAWSQDGLAIFASGLIAAAGADGQRARRVYRFPLSGGPPTVVANLPPFCTNVVVDTDARHIVCEIRRRAPDVWLADKSGRSGW
jgi:dipeptidyl aminopeptidase/acylaminoacyl peptidase